jgi:hypothetical protein
LVKIPNMVCWLHRVKIIQWYFHYKLKTENESV